MQTEVNMTKEPLQILVADDEKNLRKVLKALLERDGYEVHLAEDGLGALEILNNNHIDIVITDLRMPELDGMSLLKKIKRDERVSSRDHDHRPRHRGHGRGGHQAGCLRLYHETL